MMMFTLSQLWDRLFMVFTPKTDKKISLSFNDEFAISEKEYNEASISTDLNGEYKQRGLYKNNPTFIVTDMDLMKDVVLGYIQYRDGRKSATIGVDVELFNSFFRKVESERDE